jgi:uncharacterized membrane protein YeaQ/YmgE (transglycosylase-associated protein family)
LDQDIPTSRAKVFASKVGVRKCPADRLAHTLFAAEVNLRLGARDPLGLLGDIVVGVIGAEIGSWLGISVAGRLGSIIPATVGAIILIAILQLIKRNWMSTDKR